MKKRNISTLLCVILCAGLLTGCGGEYAGMTEGDIVSGPAVSGDAVSGDAIREKAVSGPAIKDGESQKGKPDMSSHRFCTDTNFYYVKNYNKLMQAKADGTHRKCIKEWPDKGDEENEVEVIYADKDWLYYDVWFDCDYEITYRAPIEKDAEGQDVVRFQKAEELVKTEILIPLYADSDYYFYEDLDTDKIIKFDLRKKKKVSELEDSDIFGRVYRVNDHYFCTDEYGEVYVQKVDSVQWKKLSDPIPHNDEDYYNVAQNDRALFCAWYDEKNDYRVNIKRYDEKTETDFVPWEQLSRAVTAAAGVEKLDVCVWDDFFWQEGRLYIQMQAGWMKGETYHMEYMIFSQGENEDGSGSGLRYEKELTECMKSHVKERSGKWADDYYKKVTVYIEHMVVNNAKCIAMVEGKAYLSLYDHEKDKGRLACYDLDTGKFEWISMKDAAFYKLGYDEEDMYETFETVFDGKETNDFLDDWEWYPPSKDKEGAGWFVAD